MKKLTLVKLTAVAATLAMTTQVHARSGGVTGVSGDPDKNLFGRFSNCWGCHAKPSADEYVPAFTAETLLIGPEAFTVRPGSLNDFNVQLTTDATLAGFNLSATGGTFIDLTDAAAQDENVRISGDSDSYANEVTHNKSTPVVDNKVDWAMRWQAPEVEGEATVYVCVNPVDGAGTAGDGAPLEDACISQVVNVVAGENTAPEANADSVELDQNTIATIDVLANDADDVQVLASTIEIEQMPANGAEPIVDLVKGTIQYSPNVGFSGVDSFSYTVADGEGARSEVTTVDIAVILTSGAPIIFNSEYDTFADTPLAIDVLSAVNANSAVEFTAANIEITRTNNGTVTIEESGALTYSANAGFTGIDSLTYVINAEDDAVSNEATIHITVTPKLTSDGGSFGGLMVAFIALLAGFRKTKQLSTK